MRSLLIRCYPARWRDRYGEEFEAILEERPLGPFDVADILLGALDARLRQGRRGADIATGRSFSMSLRIGGIAAMIGAPVWVAGFAISSGAVANFDIRAAAIVLVVGSLLLLIALAGLSAFQARVHPLLSWAAFALPAVGTLGLIFGAAAVVLERDELTEAFFFGLLMFFVGSLLFAIATFFTAVFSRDGGVARVGDRPCVRGRRRQRVEADPHGRRHDLLHAWLGSAGRPGGPPRPTSERAEPA